MDAPEGQAELAERLVKDLNGLFAALSLPFVITTPYDLTPSLLLATLESILRARLPISDATRQSRTPASKIAAMKILLGVLEDDVLHMDIGLSEIDPRRLAVGEWDELVFVGETLCWIAHQQGVQSPPEPHWDRGESSNMSSNNNTSVYTGFSHVDASRSSATTISWDEHPSQETALTVAPRAPRCIHEVEMNSFSIETSSVDIDASEEFCDCSDNHLIPQPSSATLSPSLTQPPVRYHGYIEPVDDDVPDFEASQERSRGQATSQSHGRETSPRHWKSTINNSGHISSPHYTLMLLEERARLLGELAKLKAEVCQNLPQAMPP